MAENPDFDTLVANVRGDNTGVDWAVVDGKGVRQEPPELYPDRYIVIENVQQPVVLRIEPNGTLSRVERGA